MGVWPAYIVAAALLTVGPMEAAAQNPGRSSPDFAQRAPVASFGLRGSWSLARANSDWYEFVTRTLTLDQRDFDAFGLGTDVGISISPRVVLVGGLDALWSSAPSEYRDYVDPEGHPISQRTRLRQLQVTGGIRVALRAPGRQIGQFIWIPARVTPYLGAGAGTLRFNLEQRGRFVDAGNLSIFRRTFWANGWGPTAHAVGGTTVDLGRPLVGVLEGRYVWGRATLRDDGQNYAGFDPIDLSGLRLSAGIALVF